MTSAGRSEFSRSKVVEQLRQLGVREGGILLVHTAFRAIGPVEGGPRGLIAALREVQGPDGTLVMPSWSGRDDEPFDPQRDPASASLGVVADAFWREPGARRSNHPFAFAAIGPAADRILADPLPIPPHRAESPVGRVHELDGEVLLLGINHDSDTTVHLGELLAGVPYRTPKHVTVQRDGRAVRIDYGENDHCCERFALVDGWLRAAGWQKEGPVGHGQARLARSRDIVAMVELHLRADPVFFLHPAGAGCVECDAARSSIR